jgi:hypothetical protein
MSPQDQNPDENKDPALDEILKALDLDNWTEYAHPTGHLPKGRLNLSDEPIEARRYMTNNQTIPAPIPDRGQSDAPLLHGAPSASSADKQSRLLP